MSINLTINNESHEVESAEGTPLLWVLRDHLGMMGTKYGCGVAQCGSCTVHVDGVPMRSCVLPHETLEGRNVTTVEGLRTDTAIIVKSVWEELDVPQCGYCQSGQMMAATALLAANKKPSDEDIDAAMSGNICRCNTYMSIRRAIHKASKELDTDA